MKRSRNGRRRGATIAEVTIGAGISSVVLFAGLSTFLLGMRSWVKGEANIEASSSSQKAVRTISNELREAMEITVNASGTRVDFVYPQRESNGTFTSPMVEDGVTRYIERSGTSIILREGNVQRTIAKDVLARKPGGASDYPLFSTPAGSVNRSLTIEIYASKPSFKGEKIVERSRETLYLRNVPQLSR